LKDAFNELDITSEVLQIVMSPEPPHFRLATFGTLGQTHVSFLCNVFSVGSFPTRFNREM